MPKKNYFSSFTKRLQISMAAVPAMTIALLMAAAYSGDV